VWLVGLRLQAFFERAKTDLCLQELVHPVGHKLVDFPDLISKCLGRACHRAFDVTTGLLTASIDVLPGRTGNTIK
jgi:hypothetical protein